MIPVDRPDDSLAFAELMSEGVSFARDGTHVAYVSTDSGSREIYIRPYPGPGGRATVSVDGGVEPQWARTGEVFYRNAAGDRMFGVTTSTVPTLNVGKPTLVFQGSYYVSPTRSPRPQYDVTADGKRFLMITSSANDSGAHFVVVQNWLDGLKRSASGEGR